ncbi:hypothetical protein B0H12DRAFT_184464 [Mycena haematopus]|nr:hypothetical protein B0H12DRAFT_184464 [Mycena haematopus]
MRGSPLLPRVNLCRLATTLRLFHVYLVLLTFRETTVSSPQPPRLLDDWRPRRIGLDVQYLYWAGDLLATFERRPQRWPILDIRARRIPPIFPRDLNDTMKAFFSPRLVFSF